MTGNAAFDVGIGLIFIYTLYSLLTTVIVEFLSINFQARAKNLKKAISRMLDNNGNNFSDDFFNQPIIKLLASGWLKLFNKPSAIQPINFSRALVQTLKDKLHNQKGDNLHEKLRYALDSDEFKDNETIKILKSLMEEAGNDINRFKTLIEQWFNEMMDRATSWYKNYVMIATFLCGFVIAAIFNVDTFQIASYLSRDTDARNQYVQLAGNFINSNSFSNPIPDTSLRNDLLNDTALMMAFGNGTQAFIKFVDDSVYNKSVETQKVLMQRMDELYVLSQKTQNILSFKRNEKNWFLFESWLNFWGCFVTALALSLGSPFWFDLLKKIIQLRGSVVRTATVQIANTENAEKPGNTN